MFAGLVVCLLQVCVSLCFQSEQPCLGSGFRQNLRVDLFSLEATLSTELRAMLRLMLSYNHHKAATEHQDPVLMSLQKSPPCNSTTLVSDWKELVTLPISHKATGEQFYATARMEVSVWGACMVEHFTADGKSKTVTRYFLVLSDILDHTCLRTNQLTRMILDRRLNQNQLEQVFLVSDPGPHYRAYEALFHNLVDLVKHFRAEVSMNFGVEKHAKGICDRLFGWFNAYVERAKENKQNIHSLDDLERVLKDGNAAQRRRDPSSPLICVILNKDSPVPQEAKRLLPTDLAIARTYCLSGKLDARIKPTALGVRLYNHVFSTRPVSVELKDYSIEALACPAEWRRGFWGSGRSNWDTDPEPLHLRKNTALSRRYDEQKSLLPRAKGRKHNALPSLDDEIKKHEASLQRRRQRNKIRQQAWSKKTSQEPSSSSTSSSSDSSAE